MIIWFILFWFTVGIVTDKKSKKKKKTVHQLVFILDNGFVKKECHTHSKVRGGLGSVKNVKIEFCKQKTIP